MHMAGPTRARDQRAAFNIEHRDLFIEQLKDEIGRLRQTATRQGTQPAVRLNGTSDVLWERAHPDLFAEFPDVQFYDYTKVGSRMSACTESSEWPENYHLTFSGDGSKPNVSQRILQKGNNVAVVFWPELPEQWWGFQVIDGDVHDARFFDPRGVIVGLRAKGIARVDLGGFVVRPCPHCGPAADQMGFIESTEGTHRLVQHCCEACGHTAESRWILPHALSITQPPCNERESEPVQLRIAA